MGRVDGDIPLRNAKEQLREIDRYIDKQLLLIGGLAVQQYDFTRSTNDIDLVCSYDTARELIAALYPSTDWTVADENQDEYRPKLRISHRFDANQLPVNLGPKVTERPAYRFLDWGLLEKDSRPFVWQGQPMEHIHVPSPEALCFSKLMSFLDRDRRLEAKIAQDLRDVCALTNWPEFRLGAFFDILRRSGAEARVEAEFAQRASKYVATLRTGTFFELARLLRHGQAEASPVRSGDLDLESLDYAEPLAQRNQERHYTYFERNAKQILSLALFIIPGPLQSLDYATIVLSMFGSQEPRAGAYARVRRRHLLAQQRTKVRVILDETIWTRFVGDGVASDDDGQKLVARESLAENLLMLRDGSHELGKLTEIRICQGRCAGNIPLQCSYDIYDDTVVGMEGLKSGLSLRDPHQVVAYKEHFEGLWRESVKGIDLRDAIDGAIETLRVP